MRSPLQPQSPPAFFGAGAGAAPPLLPPPPRSLCRAPGGRMPRAASPVRLLRRSGRDRRRGRRARRRVGRGGSRRRGGRFDRRRRRGQRDGGRDRGWAPEPAIFTPMTIPRTSSTSTPAPPPMKSGSLLFGCASPPELVSAPIGAPSGRREPERCVKDAVVGHRRGAHGLGLRGERLEIDEPRVFGVRRASARSGRGPRRSS